MTAKSAKLRWKILNLEAWNSKKVWTVNTNLQSLFIANFSSIVPYAELRSRFAICWFYLNIWVQLCKRPKTKASTEQKPGVIVFLFEGSFFEAVLFAVFVFHEWLTGRKIAYCIESCSTDPTLAVQSKRTPIVSARPESQQNLQQLKLKRIASDSKSILC